MREACQIARAARKKGARGQDFNLSPEDRAKKDAERKAQRNHERAVRRYRKELAAKHSPYVQAIPLMRIRSKTSLDGPPALPREKLPWVPRRRYRRKTNMELA